VSGTFLHDILGSTVALADSAGSPNTEYTYEPFGTTQVSGQSTTNPFQFTGRENDGAGPYYYRARYYASESSRFLGRDPMGLAAGPNAYSYALNNPLRYVDPLGLDVDVCYYADAAAGFGHVGFGLAGDERTSGFYNTGNPLNSPGELREDWQRDIRCKRIDSPPEKDRCMERCRQRRQESPGQYKLFSRQCTEYVRECLKECGLPGGPYEGPRPFPFYEGLPNKR
jgi:RHS repeat-associated protein